MADPARNRLEVETSRWERLLRGPGAPLAVVALAVVYQLPFFDRWFSFMDEGHILLYADIIANGGELYRDATVYPLPGAFYFLAWVFGFVEPSNLVARWIVMLEFAVLVGLVFVLLRKLVPPSWALAGVLVMFLYRIWAFPHWHMYNYSSTALLVQLAALLGLLRFMDTGKRTWLLLAGLLFGVGVFCKQDYGAAMLVALGSTLAVYARSGPPAARPSFWALGACFLAPAVLVGAATALHFLRQDLFGEFIQLTVLNHFIGISSYEYSVFPSLFPLFEQDPALRSLAGRGAYLPAILVNVDFSALINGRLWRETSVIDTLLKVYYYAPYLLLAVGGLRLWRCRRQLDEAEERPRYLREFALYAFGATLIVLMTLTRPQDYVHLVVLYWPLLLLALVWAHALVRKRRALAWLLALLLLWPAGQTVAYSARLAWNLHELHSAPIESPRAGIYVEPRQAQLLDDLVAYIQAQTEADEPVAVMPYFPVIQFYADRRGPHRSSYIVWPFPEFPDRDRRVIDAMEASGTRLLIYCFNEFAFFEGLDIYAPELFAYLVENFETDRIFNTKHAGYKVAAAHRVQTPPEGQPLLEGDSSQVSLSVNPAGGAPLPIEPVARSAYLAADLWPFRPVLALRPTDQGRTVLSVAAKLPEGASLRTAVGVHPRRWDRSPAARVHFELVVVDEGLRETVFSRTLQPTSRLEDRGWFEVDVPLAEYGGRSVTLEFSTGTDYEDAEKLLMGGWALPRIVHDATSGRVP
ncbi:MAG: glycosyltransferase family 39 protein [Deltaproteobacteria bacterium]|nr:glycosyltransferase family 39 protein [Deltaproteobacteria bacterium]